MIKINKKYEAAVEEWLGKIGSPNIDDYDSIKAFDRACIKSYNNWAKRNGKPIREK